MRPTGSKGGISLIYWFLSSPMLIVLSKDGDNHLVLQGNSLNCEAAGKILAILGSLCTHINSLSWFLDGGSGLFAGGWRLIVGGTLQMQPLSSVSPSPLQFSLHFFGHLVSLCKKML